ncbi:hypothetical protein [Treponema sp.]|uniref:hypothetical protein n=1 Tax=Treponema sp. TaxID=166 RepID=UPI00298E65E1|nr:hypothetical protein [Treponema sp.]MCQ2242200.1 hypothetical protein [Treponema sp.]
MEKKNFKKGVFAAFLVILSAAMFSGCVLLDLFQAGKVITDYNYVYVKNETGKYIEMIW